MAAVDEDEDGVVSQLIIADVSQDHAWLSIPTAQAVTLSDWT